MVSLTDREAIHGFMTAPAEDQLRLMRSEPSLVRLLTRSHALVETVQHSAEPGAASAILHELLSHVDGDDDVLAITAVHALSHLQHPDAEAALDAAHQDARRFIRDHAAWASWARSDSALHPRNRRSEHKPDLSSRGDTNAPARAGLRVAQPFLAAEIDPDLQHVGTGNNGGIATLLVRLGDALVQQPGIEGALTLSRGTATADHDTAGRQHAYVKVPLSARLTQTKDAWTTVAAVRELIQEALTRHGPVDVFHLRMADVGSWACWQAAQSLDIPVVFIAAPDPHVLIESLDRAGTLTRQNFGTWDETDRFWFRTWLVRELLHGARHTVLLPREHLREDIERLLGVNLAAEPTRFSPVAEGIDPAVTDSAVSEARAFAGAVAHPDAPVASMHQHAFDDLLRALTPLPAARRGLPLLISVGRLHPAKGMSRLVQAWNDPVVRQRCNLLVVGGGLQHPTDEETEQLRLIDQVIAPNDQARAGLILAGHQPNAVTVRWLAAAQVGVPGWCRPRGVYACASLKEEFGLAILEALATGLIVVAPERGGPATYLEQGRTGFLTDTSDVLALRAALLAALDAAAAPETAQREEHARSMVVERFSIHTMAEHLSRIYADVVHHHRGVRDDVDPTERGLST